MTKYNFTIIVTQEGKWRVARCVELGVVSQGKTIEQAQKNLKEAVELYLEGQSKNKTKKYSSNTTPLVGSLELTYA